MKTFATLHTFVAVLSKLHLLQLGGNESSTPHKRPEHVARLTQVYASNAAVTFGA